MQKAITPATSMSIGGKKLTLSRSEIGQFREAMLKSPGTPGYERWKKHSNTQQESFLGPYLAKINKTIAKAREEKSATEIELCELDTNRKNKEITRAELECRIAKTQKSIEKDLADAISIEAQSLVFVDESEKALEKAGQMIEEIKDNSFLSQAGNATVNKVWKEFARDAIGIPDEFTDIFMTDEDSPQLAHMFLLGHPAYSLLYEVKETLADYDKITPLTAMSILAQMGGYKMPEFSQVKSITDIDKRFIEDMLQVYDRFKNAQSQYAAAFKDTDRKIAQAKKYIDGKSRQYDTYKKGVKRGKTVVFESIEGLGLKDFEKLMETELEYSRKAYSLAFDTNARMKNLYSMSKSYCKAVLDSVEKLLTRAEYEKELAGLELDASFDAKHNALVKKLASQQSRLEDLESARETAQKSLAEEMERIEAKVQKSKARSTSDENLLAYLETIEAGEKKGEPAKNYVFESKFSHEEEPAARLNTLGQDAIDGFISRLSQEFPVMQKSYPNYMGTFIETMEAMARAYADNGFRLSKSAIFMAFPGRVKEESTYKKFTYKPVRIAIDSYGMLRLLVDISDKEKPLIFFLGPKSESEKVMPRDSLKQAIEYARMNPALNDLFEVLKAKSEKPANGNGR